MNRTIALSFAFFAFFGAAHAYDTSRLDHLFEEARVLAGAQRNLPAAITPSGPIDPVSGQTGSQGSGVSTSGGISLPSVGEEPSIATQGSNASGSIVTPFQSQNPTPKAALVCEKRKGLREIIASLVATSTSNQKQLADANSLYAQIARESQDAIIEEACSDGLKKRITDLSSDLQAFSPLAQISETDRVSECIQNLAERIESDLSLASNAGDNKRIQRLTSVQSDVVNLRLNIERVGQDFDSMGEKHERLLRGAAEKQAECKQFDDDEY